jgi:hypothetical protein
VTPTAARPSAIAEKNVRAACGIVGHRRATRSSNEAIFETGSTGRAAVSSIAPPASARRRQRGSDRRWSRTRPTVAISGKPHVERVEVDVADDRDDFYERRRETARRAGAGRSDRRQ